MREKPIEDKYIYFLTFPLKFMTGQLQIESLPTKKQK
jgi:hypothetical protein